MNEIKKEIITNLKKILISSSIINSEIDEKNLMTESKFVDAKSSFIRFVSMSIDVTSQGSITRDLTYKWGLEVSIRGDNIDLLDKIIKEIVDLIDVLRFEKQLPISTLLQAIEFEPEFDTTTPIKTKAFIAFENQYRSDIKFRQLPDIYNNTVNLTLTTEV